MPKLSVYNDLAKETFISLITFKRNGEGRPTPVWFTSIDGNLYVFTELHSWKVRRIRNNPNVLIAPCKFDGTETGERLAAKARLLSIAESPEVLDAFLQKYGIQFKFFNLMGKLKRAENILIELSPSEIGEF